MKTLFIVINHYSKFFDMKKSSLFLLTVVLFLSCSTRSPEVEVFDYDGRYCSGNGDTTYLQLIDESFAFLHPNPVVPNLSMLYKPEWNTLVEGAGWGGWWIQNSYGFSYAATPFLSEPWFTLLQNSWDLFWQNQGDGERKGRHGKEGSLLHELVAPDGSLGDAAGPDFIVYKQGDGDVRIHDWYYEGAAAGLVMQTEILLANRDIDAINHYLPKMERAFDFIERKRDPENNLFLVGPAANLLAPSYGGVKQPDGTFGPAYLAGLSITYLAALDRMVELYKLVDDQKKLKEYAHRQNITRESIPLLLTKEGYFVKSIEPNGTKHGVLGQEQYGYLEGVANADAVALRIADDETSESIYRQIASFPRIRPFDFMLTNAPGLDDTYWNWGNTEGEGMGGFHEYGTWVNGGVWGTVEGRVILMYSRLGKFDDIFRSASRAMKWAKDFRMDAPWSQFGENTNNPWSDTGKFQVGGVAVMIDNFAIPAATIRGLLDYEYRFNSIILRPRIPGGITYYNQKDPVRFGNKKLFFSCNNGGPKVSEVTVNGTAIDITDPDELVLFYDDLPEEAQIEITTTGGWHQGSTDKTDKEYPHNPALMAEQVQNAMDEISLPESLKEPYAVLSRMKERLAKLQGAGFEKAFVGAALKACEACGVRAEIDPGQGYFRPINQQREDGIILIYEQTALSLYNGFENQMKSYAENNDAKKNEIAAIFSDVKSGL